ncbi:MAG: glutathione S-transferase N-terminal domain-containing protein, partial [Bdellovibrionia bacterium]
MKLYTSLLSHFARKARILLDSYSIPYEIIDVGNVAEGEAEKFGNNPLLRVPVLVDGETWMIDSDHIAQYIVRKHDPTDQYQVLTHDTNDLNVRAVLNGIMSEEVTVIIARRLSVPTDQYSFFDDALDAIKNGLAWLE